MNTTPNRSLIANLTLLSFTLLTCLLLLELTLRLFDSGDNIRITAKLNIFTPHPTPTSPSNPIYC